jgi:hypothetical protein
MVMNRLVLLGALLVATTALATGERIVLVPATSQLQETLCLSMTCVTGRGEATVATKQTKNGVEISVTMADGQKRLTHLVPASSEGTMSSTDLVRATSLVLQAIEVGPTKGDQPVAAAAPPRAKPAKLPLKRALAHR